jgi:hypothetical protein
MYRRVLAFVEQLMALRFTATGVPPAECRILILPMNQHAY